MLRAFEVLGRHLSGVILSFIVRSEPFYDASAYADDRLCGGLSRKGVSPAGAPFLFSFACRPQEEKKRPSAGHLLV